MYALYTSEAEFAGPLFKTVDDAHNYVFNNRSILIPLKEKKTTLMSLQVIYDENLKVHVDKRSSVQQANSITRAAVARQSSMLMSNAKRKFKQNVAGLKGMGAGQTVPGWT